MRLGHVGGRRLGHLFLIATRKRSTSPGWRALNWLTTQMRSDNTEGLDGLELNNVLGFGLGKGGVETTTVSKVLHGEQGHNKARMSAVTKQHAVLQKQGWDILHFQDVCF